MPCRYRGRSLKCRVGASELVLYGQVPLFPLAASQGRPAWPGFHQSSPIAGPAQLVQDLAVFWGSFEGSFEAQTIRQQYEALLHPGLGYLLGTYYGVLRVLPISSVAVLRTYAGSSSDSMFRRNTRGSRYFALTAKKLSCRTYGTHEGAAVEKIPRLLGSTLLASYPRHTLFQLDSRLEARRTPLLAKAQICVSTFFFFSPYLLFTQVIYRVNHNSMERASRKKRKKEREENPQKKEKKKGGCGCVTCEPGSAQMSSWLPRMELRGLSELARPLSSGSGNGNN
ncbi:hypothetical protein V8C37DRAFT_222692 [Trichoderma ceciliae]